MQFSNKLTRLSLSIAVSLPSLFSYAQSPPLSADTIVLNADVRTVDPSKPRAQSFAIQNGKFIAVGSEFYVKKLQNAKTKVIDAKGHTVIPGLTDAHTHFLGGTDLAFGVDLFNIADRARWLDIIAKKDKELPEGAWIVGGRWDVTLTEQQDLPTRYELDAIVPDRPIALLDSDFHSMWINTAAMKLLNITTQTVSPAGGVIVKDIKTGEPTGILKENAMELVTQSAIYKKAEPPKTAALMNIIRYFNSLGVTSVHDMWSDDIKAYQELLATEPFSMRVWFGLMADSSDSQVIPKAFQHYAKQRDKMNALSQKQEKIWQQGPQFRLGYIKYFADGVLSTYTAALNDAYSDHADIHGTPIHSQDKLNKLVKLAHDQNFPVAIHAIGDKSVDMVMEAFSLSPQQTTLPDRIEHIEVVETQTVPKFSQYNIVASMQPNHAIQGSYIPSRLGEPRLERSYAWQTLLSSGAKLVLGSDWPTAVEIPLLQIGDAVLRERDGKTWHGENALSFDEALYAYTQAPADIAGWGNQIGSISVGKWADFAIIDGTVSEPLPQDIRNWKIEQTWFAGKQVFQK